LILCHFPQPTLFYASMQYRQCHQESLELLDETQD
jgi:hypothetical protein